MKMKMKKFLVAALAVTMIMGSSSITFAGEVSQSEGGTGGLEIVAQEDVFHVQLPVSVKGYFNYILDPGHVISETDAANFGGKKFKNPATNTMFFQQDVSQVAAGKVSDYEPTSSKVKAVNMSTGNVDITVDAKVVSAGQVTLTPSSALTNVTDTAALAFQLVDGNGSKDITAANTSVTKGETINAKANAYEVTIANGKYVKQLKKDQEVSTFNAYEFWITGACNSGSDAEEQWRDIDSKDLPQINLLWTVKGDGEAASGTGSQSTDPTVSISRSGLLTISNLTKDLNVKSTANDMKIGPKDEGAIYKMNDLYIEWDTTNWKKTNGDEGGGTLKGQFKGKYADWNDTDMVLEVILNNGLAGEKTITWEGQYHI